MPTIELNSNLKLITSGDIPTTQELAPGELAFGYVGPTPKMYGNADGTIVEFTVDLSDLQTAIAQLESAWEDPTTIITGSANSTTGDVALVNNTGGAVVSFNYLLANFAKLLSLDPDTNILTLDINGDTATVDLTQLIPTIPAANPNTFGGIRLINVSPGVYDIRTDLP